jgi:hypothetical protein
MPQLGSPPAGGGGALNISPCAAEMLQLDRKAPSTLAPVGNSSIEHGMMRLLPKPEG